MEKYERRKNSIWVTHMTSFYLKNRNIFDTFGRVIIQLLVQSEWIISGKRDEVEYWGQEAQHPTGQKSTSEWERERVNFDQPSILAKINTKSKRQADFKLDCIELLMIKLHQTGPGTGFNEDEGRRIRTKQWDPLLIRLREESGICKQ